MRSEIEISVDPQRIDDADYLDQRIKKEVIPERGQSYAYELLRRSIDARRTVHYRLRYAVYIGEEVPQQVNHATLYTDVTSASVVHIIGAGPAGYFAALQCLKSGLKPVIYDRGKDAQARRRDLKAVQQDGTVNPDSNYCFGEGGAGTYSDGKLYTRSHKRGPVRDVLEMLVEHGADKRILSDAHPHIGSNRLPKIIEAIRETIEQHGGEVYFDRKVTDLKRGDGHLMISFADSPQIKSSQTILATGHSARDIYTILHSRGIQLEAKDLAIGVRVEHPQPLIDRLQYKRHDRGPLPPSRYTLRCKVDDRSVFSFCMCPGGLIVPTATSPGEIVINGMSLSRRDSPFANSGIVVEVSVDQIPEPMGKDALRTMRYQEWIEKTVFQHGDGSQAAPAQRLTDFIKGRASKDLGPSSYIPGIYPARLDLLLPSDIAMALQRGFRYFGKRMKGYVTDTAQILAVETRTSAPIRIPRDFSELNHPDWPELYPCGEGAGYAGGIMSAALDGMRVVSKIAEKLHN